MNIKSTLVKAATASMLAVLGLVTLNNNKASNQAQAATLPAAVTVKYVPNYSIAVWNNPTNPQLTGKLLKDNTAWKVFDSSTDANGNVWYNLGGNQWIMSKYTVAGIVNVRPVAQVQQQAPAQNGRQNQAPVAQRTQSQAPVSTVSGSEAAAKAWIAGRESGGSYTARNGQYYGKYQLSSAYLGGDYSPANQERVADNYVRGRYGSWTNAQSFWMSHGWY